MHRILERYRSWHEFCRWLAAPRRRQEAKSLPIRTRMALYRRGFFPNKYQLYQLDKNNWKLFVTDKQMLRSSRIDGDYGIILDDKVLFELMMHHFVSVPRNFAMIYGGKLVWLDGDQEKDRDLFELVKQQKKVMIKPTDKSSGWGIQLMEFRDGNNWQNGRAIDEKSLQDTFFESGEIIVSEYVRQGAYANKLYPETVNTIRMLTMLDPESQIPFVAAAIQRIGCAKFIPVDNISSGGMACNIDLKTGRLGKASKVFAETPFRWFDQHPETKVIFEDQVVPDWNSICIKMLDLAGKLPMLPYIAWDIAILDDGITVIEGNRWADVGCFQIHQPLFADHRVRNFFKHHNVL